MTPRPVEVEAVGLRERGKEREEGDKRGKRGKRERESIKIQSKHLYYYRRLSLFQYKYPPSDGDSERFRRASTGAESLSGQTLGSISIIKQVTRGQRPCSGITHNQNHMMYDTGACCINLINTQRAVHTETHKGWLHHPVKAS